MNIITDYLMKQKGVFFESIGPIVFRREMRKISNSNKGLVIRLNNILEKHIQEGDNSAFVGLMVNPSKDYSTIESVVNALKDMNKGFNNSIYKYLFVLNSLPLPHNI